MKTKFLKVTRKVEIYRTVFVEVPEAMAPIELEDLINEEREVFDYLDSNELSVRELGHDDDDHAWSCFDVDFATDTEEAELKEAFEGMNQNNKSGTPWTPRDQVRLYENSWKTSLEVDTEQEDA